MNRLWVALLCLLPVMAWPQTLYYDRPVEKSLQAPSLKKQDEAPPRIDLPPPPAGEGLAASVTVTVKQFRFEGNTVFSSDELATVTQPYENIKLGSSQLESIRQALSRYYIDRGYLNSGAILPDQKISDGIITFRIIEGRLSIIQLSGQEDLHHSYIYDRIVLGVDTPLNVKQLQNQLFLLQQDPRIKTINARLQPGVEAGDSVLYVDVEEDKPYAVKLNFNNHRPPSVGAERLELDLVHYNLTGYGDEINFRYGFTEGLDDYDLHYSYPLSANNTRINVYYSETDSEVVEEPFASLDTLSLSTTVGVGVNYPVFRNSDAQLELALNLEKRKSETFLLGLPYSFEAGPQDGVSRVSVWRFAQSWFQRSFSSVVALRSTFNFGFDAMDATINDIDPDGKFQSWLGQFQWLERFHGNQSDLIFRSNLQLSDDPLLPLEQFAIGGVNSVRGYRENQLVGDNGINLSIEYRYPLVNASDNLWQLAVFSDYGRVWNKQRASSDPNDLYSAGLGLRWTDNQGMGFDLYWGEALRDTVNNNNDLQDDGIHFQFYMELL